MNARKWSIALGVTGLIVLVMAVLLPAVGINLFGGPAAASDSCASTGITADKPFYADLAPVGSNQFGPSQNYHDKDRAFKMLSTVMNCDSYVAATEVDFRVSGDQLSVDQANTTAKTYGSDKAKWTKAVQGYLGNVNLGKSYTKYENSHYATLGMVPNGKKQPTLFSASPDRPAGWVLVLVFKDGTTRELRIACLFQPVSPRFPHVPTCTSSANHGCTPPCPGNCSPPPSHCVCVSKTAAQQPVPSPAAPKQNVPAQAPPAKAPQPVNAGNPPTSTPGGYNGGSTSRPGQSAPPDTPHPVVSATGDPGGF